MLALAWMVFGLVSAVIILLIFAVICYRISEELNEIQKAILAIVVVIIMYFSSILCLIRNNFELPKNWKTEINMEKVEK